MLILSSVYSIVSILTNGHFSLLKSNSWKNISNVMPLNDIVLVSGNLMNKRPLYEIRDNFRVKPSKTRDNLKRARVL